MDILQVNLFLGISLTRAYDFSLFIEVNLLYTISLEGKQLWNLQKSLLPWKSNASFSVSQKHSLENTCFRTPVSEFPELFVTVPVMLPAPDLQRDNLWKATQRPPLPALCPVHSAVRSTGRQNKNRNMDRKLFFQGKWSGSCFFWAPFDSYLYLLATLYWSTVNTTELSFI